MSKQYLQHGGVSSGRCCMVEADRLLFSQYTVSPLEKSFEKNFKHTGAGNNSNSTPTSWCQACPAGTYSTTGSLQKTFRLYLVLNSHVYIGQTSCTPCPTYQYRTANQTACTACNTGFYALLANESHCTACAASCSTAQYSDPCPSDPNNKFVCRDCPAETKPSNARWINMSSLATAYSCLWVCNTGYWQVFSHLDFFKSVENLVKPAKSTGHQRNMQQLLGICMRARQAAHSMHQHPRLQLRLGLRQRHQAVVQLRLGRRMQLGLCKWLRAPASQLRHLDTVRVRLHRICALLVMVAFSF